MITGWDRLTAAAAGRTCDRIPVFCNLLDQGAREMGVSLRDYYGDPACVAEAQLRLREKYGHDNLWSLFYVGKEAEFFGCREILFAEDGPPNVAELVIRNNDDIGRLEVPEDIAGHPAFAPVAECLRLLRREAGGRYPICAYVTAATCLPVLLMEMEGWLELLLAGPAVLRDQLLAKCEVFVVRQAAALRAAGADLLLYSNPFGSLDTVPERVLRERVLPSMRRELAPLGTAGMIYYCGGARLGRVIETAVEGLGFTSLYFSPLDDLAAAKRAVAGRALTCGVIDDIKMVHWSEDEVRREVARIIAAGAPGGRFLFGTMVMPLAIPEANIRAMMEAACRFGGQDGGGAP
ncbi:MAG: uroporphyrinogen decarboxylase family protein [Rhodospirillaceae bacterium]